MHFNLCNSTHEQKTGRKMETKQKLIQNELTTKKNYKTNNPKYLRSLFTTVAAAATTTTMSTAAKSK